MEETGLAIIEQVPVIAQSLPVVLNENNESLQKAKDYGQKLYSDIENGGMNDELDKKVNDFLCALKSTVKKCNDKRSAITQFFASITKQFTSIESEIDTKSEIYTKGQGLRDAWAEKKRNEEIERQAVLKLKADQEKERISLKASISLNLRKHFLEYLELKTKELVNILENATIEAIEGIQQKIELFSNLYSSERFQGYKEIPLFAYIATDEAKEILAQVKTNDLFLEYSIEFSKAMQQKKIELIEKIPGKLKELEAIKAANEEEKLRLKAIAEKRKNDEAAKLAEETQQKTNEAQATIETAKQVETANTLFEIQQQAGATEKVAQGIEFFELIISNIAVLPMIISFWWEREGRFMVLADLEKKTIKQMVAFVEKWAKSKGERISSPYIEYKPIYKTKAISK